MTSDDGHSQTIELMLVRHAAAGDPGEWRGSDAARPLTAKGRAQSERLGTFLADGGHYPDVIVSSPKVRAAQTAELIAEQLSLEYRLDDRLAGGLDLAALAALLADLDAGRPMLVGHDPDFTELIGELCSTSGVEMKKGALARIDLQLPPEAGSGVLRWLVPPDLLPRS